MSRAQMIDIHSHILPGLDDGPGTLEEALGLARRYREAGFETVVSTPHWIRGTTWMGSVRSVQEKLSELNRALRKEEVGLTVRSGMEIGLDPDVPGSLVKGEVLPLAGTAYVLIEPPFHWMPHGWEHVLFELAGRGYRPVIAHVERSGRLAGDPEKCRELADSGVFFQANWASVLGGYGKAVSRAFAELAGRGLIHCMGTDSHDARRRHPGLVAVAERRLEELVGPENAHLLAHENPSRLVEGNTMLPPWEREPTKKRRWFFL